MADFQRLRLDLAYDGTFFHGWAAQPGLRTVQGDLEEALSTVLRRPVQLTVAGRTDAGVHAAAQVAHLDANEAEVGQLTVRRLQGLLDRLEDRFWRQGSLPERPGGTGDIVLRSLTPVSPEFDARFSATARHYRYQIADRSSRRDPATRWSTWWSPTELDQELMNTGAQQLRGEWDFLSFCRPREGATTIRTLRHLTVSRDEADGTLAVEVSADAFCHSMVRTLVGALVEVGRGYRTLDWLAELVRQPSRQWGVPVVPARGLTLVGVDYPPREQWAERAREARRRRDSEESGTVPPSL
ncbi:tRNA pseudouridine(38-40) synthase TruA [Actinomyces sp. F1_1611]